VKRIRRPPATAGGDEHDPSLLPQCENGSSRRRPVSSHVGVPRQEVLFLRRDLGLTPSTRVVPAAFARPSEHLNLSNRRVHTAVLIGASMDDGARRARRQAGAGSARCSFLVLTRLLGSVLSVSRLEYAEKFHSHHVPRAALRMDGSGRRPVQLFFGLYSR